MQLNLGNWSRGLVALLALAIGGVAAQAAPKKAAEPAPEATEVEMFDGMKSGQIEVKFIPTNSKLATVLIQNKTKQPLKVKLPEAFAGVPVLAQALGVGGQGAGGLAGGQQNQQVGGGFGGQQGGLGGGVGGGGNNLFNVGPEKLGKIKVVTVCLEHGKKEPFSGARYEIRPLESVSKSPELYQLCKTIGEGQVDQHTAQAAAWHINNGMTWQQLATKQLKRLQTGAEPYFSAAHLTLAVKLVEHCKAEAAKQPAPSTEASTSASDK